MIALLACHTGGRLLRLCLAGEGRCGTHHQRVICSPELQGVNIQSVALQLICDQGMQLIYNQGTHQVSRGAQSCVRDCTCIQDELEAASVLATRGARLTSIHLTHANWAGAEGDIMQQSAESPKPRVAVRGRSPALAACFAYAYALDGEQHRAFHRIACG